MHLFSASLDEVGHIDDVLGVAVHTYTAFAALDFVVEPSNNPFVKARHNEPHDPGPVGLDRLDELHEGLDA